ncbi:MAG: hypothetical protein QOH24_1892 [Verrucomicrobiota bacterium]
MIGEGLWVAHASRVLVLPSRQNEFFREGYRTQKKNLHVEKFVPARRRHQHARRVRYPIH